MTFPQLSPEEILQVKHQDKVWQVESESKDPIKKWRDELNLIFEELLSDQSALVLKLHEIYENVNKEEITLADIIEDYYVNLKKEFEEPGLQKKKHAILAARALYELSESSKQLETNPEEFTKALNIFHHRAEESHIYPRVKIATLSVLSAIVGYLLTFVVRLLTFLLVCGTLGISMTPFAPLVLAAAIPYPFLMPIAGSILNLIGLGVMAKGISMSVASYKSVLITRNDGIYLANSIFKCLTIPATSFDLGVEEKEEKVSVPILSAK